MKVNIFSLLLGLILIQCTEKNTADYSKWTNYAGTKGGARYSSLNQINTENVKQLQVAWRYECGDGTKKSQIQCQPIVIDTILYGTTPSLNLFALHAATGKEIWRFNPIEVLGKESSWAGVNRGVTFYENKELKRIFFCVGSYLLSVNVLTGEPDLNFGDHGKVDLQKGLTDNEKDKFLLTSNTPGIIFEDKIILGMRLSEGLDAAPGHVRAYNVITGKQEWIFHTIPKKGEFGYDSWDEQYIDKIGGANNWSGLTLDEERGIVYVPTGSATYDFWGGYREGDNLFANCLIALNANTGKRIWHFQTIHHDIWDRDLPANPNLVTIKKDGKNIDAIAQISKQGYVFLFDRITGESIYPIEEKPVLQSTMIGEKSSATQPVPTLPEAFARQEIKGSDLLSITPELKEEVRKIVKNYDYGNMWLSPNHEKGFVLLPGFDGGGEWGGAAYDPESQWLYVNSNEMPWLVDMAPNIKSKSEDSKVSGSQVYANNCANCHGLDRKGNTSAFPNLLEINKKYSLDSLATLLITGRGGMPSFSHLSEEKRATIIAFILGDEDASMKIGSSQNNQKLISPYLLKGYRRFLTKDGYPGINPPWGTLNAIDLNTGKIVWKSILGEFPELTAQGIPITGRENYGGPVVTAGGLIFIAATEDEMLRAFDKQTGEMLWQTKLPASGHATPAVYEIDGKQFVVIACGGGKGSKSGDSYLAFALP